MLWTAPWKPLKYVLLLLAIERCGYSAYKSTMVPPRSFYEDHSGHKLVVKSRNLPTCWLDGLELGARTAFSDSSSPCAERECGETDSPRRKTFLSLLKWESRLRLVWHRTWLFSSGSEGHLEVWGLHAREAESREFRTHLHMSREDPGVF